MRRKPHEESLAPSPSGSKEMSALLPSAATTLSLHERQRGSHADSSSRVKPLDPSTNTFLPPQLIGSCVAGIHRRQTLDTSTKFDTHNPYSKMVTRTTLGRAAGSASREADMVERARDL